MTDSEKKLLIALVWIESDMGIKADVRQPL